MWIFIHFADYLNFNFFTQYLFLNKKKVTFSWRLESKRTRGKSNHKFRALAENEETENFDGLEAVPNPEAQEILNSEPLLEADADPGKNITIATCFETCSFR